MLWGPRGRRWRSRSPSSPSSPSGGGACALPPRSRANQRLSSTLVMRRSGTSPPPTAAAIYCRAKATLARARPSKNGTNSPGRSALLTPFSYMATGAVLLSSAAAAAGLSTGRGAPSALGVRILWGGAKSEGRSVRRPPPPPPIFLRRRTASWSATTGRGVAEKCPLPWPLSRGTGQTAEGWAPRRSFLLAFRPS